MDFGREAGEEEAWTLGGRPWTASRRSKKVSLSFSQGSRRRDYSINIHHPAAGNMVCGHILKGRWRQGNEQMSPNRGSQDWQRFPTKY